jgi:hypothetical protein
LLKKALLTDAQAQRFISMSGIASVADFVDTTRGELIEELMRTLEVPKFSAAATATKILRVSSARMMIALPAAAAKKPPIGQQSTWDRLASPPARWAVADAAKSADKAKAELIASGGTHRTRSAPPCLPIGGASCGYWYTVHRGGGAPDATQRVAAPMFPTAKIEEECTATYSSVEATVARRREASSSESDANVRRLAAVVKQAHKAAAVREVLERAKRADERRRAQFARDAALSECVCKRRSLKEHAANVPQRSSSRRCSASHAGRRSTRRIGMRTPITEPGSRRAPRALNALNGTTEATSLRRQCEGGRREKNGGRIVASRSLRESTAIPSSQRSKRSKLSSVSCGRGPRGTRRRGGADIAYQ